MVLGQTDIARWLRTEDERSLEALWCMADQVRRETVGEAVHLRGLIEISNHCIRTCAYCGLSATNKQLQRYRMTADEIMDCVRRTAACGYGTIVLQAGEDYGIEAAWLARIIRSVKRSTALAVTLGMGERPYEDLRLWRDAGADRYLLRFETSDRALYRLLHPPRSGQTDTRLEILHQLRSFGYEVGSGIMVGIPGQTYSSIAEDLILFRDLDLDMIGIGPYIPHPQTLLSSGQLAVRVDPAEQVPNTETMTYKVIALSRLVCPEANIPSTTALATINPRAGREQGLQRGANVVMPNCTPVKYRRLYEIYPGKACVHETADDYREHLLKRIASIGRSPGTGQGGRQRRTRL